MGFFDFFRKKSDAPQQPAKSFFLSVVDEAFAEIARKNESYYDVRPNKLDVFTEKVLPLPDKDKADFVISAIHELQEYQSRHTQFENTGNKGWKQARIADGFLRHMLKMTLVLDDEDIATISGLFTQYATQTKKQHIIDWPVSHFIIQVERQLKQRAPGKTAIDALLAMQKELSAPSRYYEKERIKISAKMDALMMQFHEGGEQVMQPAYFTGKDEFSDYANAFIRNAPDADRSYWFRLVMLSRQVTGSKPSKKFLQEVQTIFDAWGTEAFRKVANKWFEFIVKLKETNHPERPEYYYSILASPNIEPVKGFIWMCILANDKVTLFNIAAVAERCYRKIPGGGPVAASVGNAGLYTLAKAKGLDGVGHLSRLKLRIRQANAQNFIDKYLQEAAAEQDVSVYEIEDLAVDDYGLTDGKREYEFDGYKLRLSIAAIGSIEMSWLKPDGSPQKAVPASVKEKYSAQLKEIKDLVKQAEVTLTAQRDRIDRMFKAERKIPWQKFNEFYFSHGLMSFISKGLIWNIEQGGKTIAALFRDNAWVDSKGQKYHVVPEEKTMFSLWHPVFSSMDDIRLWREWMLENNIMQPLKQAFREVYLLTDAEINTRTYSNRMAAHILKQHQFNSLAKVRGWKYSLLGAYDDGRDNEAATISLPDYNLQAEFWVTEVNADNAFNPAGIWLYIATDQVRFVNTATKDVVELAAIPKIVFSEVMRDVDLFVGVASVGNDPAWRDNGGVPAYRDYWQSYSFGDLTEVAKTRKIILERLLPRLKISKVATIKDKFLIVQGKLRTYKIHIGSTNILMEPNDQYLCIVPDRSKREGTDNLFLPFEGDNGLSVIISKAILLSADDAITDPSITRQIAPA